MNEMTPPDWLEEKPRQNAFGETLQHVGQGTHVEQARAIAEVRAAVMIAMESPRDMGRAIAQMREVCRIPKLAERAFYSVKRGKMKVQDGNGREKWVDNFASGESIHLARELARCWGNINYGVKELSQDETRGQSEMLAFAWDMETNARSEITFIVPHVKGSARRRLTGTQEIYENNASFSGRRLREVIFNVLPVWFREEAAEICHKTLESGGGVPLEKRRADCIEGFGSLGVSREQLEAYVGKDFAQATAEDIAQLGVTYRSIKRNEVSKDEIFPVAQKDQQSISKDADAFERAAHGEQA